MSIHPEKYISISFHIELKFNSHLHSILYKIVLFSDQIQKENSQHDHVPSGTGSAVTELREMKIFLSISKIINFNDNFFPNCSFYSVIIISPFSFLPFHFLPSFPLPSF